jgi:hypothetical protein
MTPINRRWFRFSLRTLLVGMALLAVVGGWLGAQVDRARNRRNAIHQIEADGGRVYGLGESAHHRPKWLLKLDLALGDFGEVTAVVLPDNFGDNDAARITQLFPEAVVHRGDLVIYRPSSPSTHLKPTTQSYVPVIQQGEPRDDHN